MQFGNHLMGRMRKAVGNRLQAVGVLPPSLVALTFRLASFCFPRLRSWVEPHLLVPEGEWYKDFGSFKICGAGPYPRTFLLSGQQAKGESL